MEEKKQSKVVSSDLENNPITVYCHIIYRTFGKSLLSNKSFKNFFTSSIYNKKYEAILKKGNLKLLPEEYFISVFLSMIFIFIFVVCASGFLLFINPANSALIFYLGIATVFFMGLFMYNYPIVLAKDRGKQIDASIPYLLPYMKILGKELNLTKIIGIIDDFLVYKEVRVEFKRIKYYTEFLGYDTHSAIREAMLSCPSRELSDLLNDLVTISNSGGNIYAYLDRKLDNLNQEIDAIEKKNIDTLLIYSQIYVVILLIAPLFFTIMTAVLNLVEFSADAASASISSGAQSSIFTIILLLVSLPFAYAGFMMLIFYSKPLYSRLTPIKK